MQLALISTKLYFPPSRLVITSRPRLVERLAEGLHGPLTLLSAPVGSGKTTLLSEWRAGPGANTPVAWLSLDAADNDPLRFFHYLLAALEPLKPALAQEIQPLLQSNDSQNVEAILILLVNILSALPQDFLLVLDDYHIISANAIHDAMAFLLDHLPPAMHIALLTRADPPLPLARLRARGQLTELRAADLRFSLAESATFLIHDMGLALSVEQVTALEGRTEGWIAGLQLAALALHALQQEQDPQEFIKAFTGSHRYIVDYLADEVLNHLPETLRDFLMKTSILERFSAPLCDAVVEDHAQSEAILRQLERSNLFLIPLDHEQCWYRYHHLFADLLHSRLIHSEGERVALLHDRAAAWFEQNNLIDEAIHHALAARNFERASRLFRQGPLAILYARSLSLLEQWLQAFPEEFLHSDPWLCIAKAHVLWATGRRDVIAPVMANAEKALAGLIGAGKMDENSTDATILQGEILAFQALNAMGNNNLSLAVSLAQRAITKLPATSRSRVFALGSLYMAYIGADEIDRAIEICNEAATLARPLQYFSMHTTATYTQANLLRIKGNLHRSAQVARDALAYAERHGQSHIFYYGVVHISLAETLYEWNRLDEMELALNTGLKLCRQGGMNILVVLGMIAQARLKHAQGDIASALNVLAQIEHDCREMDARMYQEECTELRVWFQAENGDLTGVAEKLPMLPQDVELQVGLAGLNKLYQAADYLLLLGRAKEAMQIMERLLPQVNFDLWRLLILISLAVACEKSHQQNRALGYLRQALALAEPEGFVRVFLNRGEAVQMLLQMLPPSERIHGFAAKVLAGFPAPLQTAASKVAKVELLSKREVELLHLIADGRSNKEIATQLVISIGTVKRHTVNIFTKLDVKNRTEAVAKARELGLL